MPDTLTDYLEVSKRSCNFNITNLVRHEYEDDAVYFGSLRICCTLSIKPNFVEDNINRPLCFDIITSTPKSFKILTGKPNPTNTTIVSNLGDSTDDVDMYEGGFCSMNASNYITTYSPTIRVPDSLAEPTFIEFYRNGSQRSFYLKYLSDRKNVSLKSLSSVAENARYVINFIMPLYYIGITGFSFYQPPKVSWSTVESFRA